MNLDEQQKYAEPKDKRTLQQKHFDELFASFFAFYQDALRGDPANHEKVRLMLTTQFFDDLGLRKIVDPVFAKFPTNVEEKRAVARAAYFDALSLHNRTAGLVFETVSEKELAAKRTK